MKMSRHLKNHPQMNKTHKSLQMTLRVLIIQMTAQRKPIRIPLKMKYSLLIMVMKLTLILTLMEKLTRKNQKNILTMKKI